VTRVTGALSPFIIPMIKSLAAIEEQDVALLSHIGDDE